MDIPWAEYWWDKITGPHEAVQSVADTLHGGKSVLFVVPDDLPWRHEMRGSIRAALSSSYGLRDVVITTIDCADDPESSLNPGQYLLKRFARSRDRLAFRPGTGGSLQDFLISREVLKNMVVWVKGVDAESEKTWIDFCSSFRSDTFGNGLFVIEAHEVTSVEHPRLEVIDLKEYVSVFDARLFNSTVVSDYGQELADSYKRYLTALLTKLCGTDVEVSEYLASCQEEWGLDPRERIALMVEDGMFPNRGLQSPNHILSLQRGGRTGELERRVWSAQVEVIYPLIEEERLKLVEEFSEDLDKILCTSIVEQFGSRITDRLDVELGTLVSLIARHKDSFKSSSGRDRAHLLRDCRNALAHMSCCGESDVTSLLGAARY